MSEFTAKGEISKVDEDQRQVFGWASVTDLDGEPVTDRQNDWVATEDLEKAAYDYVLSSRVGGTMHERVGKSKPKPTSTMIESFVVTPEKIEKMGLPEGSLPLGWWMGFQINDDQTWNQVKKGKLGSFSIHGAGRRKQVDKADIRKSYESTLAQVWKACEGDQVLFTKAIAHLTDEAYDRGHGDAHFYEQVLKHLIGSHDQKDHDPKSHSRSEHNTAGGSGKVGLGGAGFGAAAGFARGMGLDGGQPLARGGKGALIGAGVGGTLGAVTGAFTGAREANVNSDEHAIARRFEEKVEQLPDDDPRKKDPDKMREVWREAEKEVTSKGLSDHEKQILTKYLGS